ncbi:MAG TPA: magnesium transporter CorA family protein [Candidatus Microsaccharimonas sp.]|nr:magnesium transporter CorA family protein [Candidatus Microsaccharimonas sp.]
MITTYYSKARERALQLLESPRIGSWIVVSNPTEAELDKLATDFKLERDNLTDAIDPYEAPRIEVEDKRLYIYTRYCYPEGVEIATDPLLIISTEDHLLCIVRTDTNILDRLTSNVIDVVTTQKTKTLLQILGEINLSYERQLNRVSKRILQLRGRMRQGEISKREFIGIIELEEDMNEFLSALQPQALLLSSLLNGKYLKLYEQDRDIIEDIERSTGELIEQLRGRLRTLSSMRAAYDAIATTNLNATFKRLTSIAIFLTIPTIISGIWGMNVGLPLQHSRFGFLFVIVLISTFISGAVWFFNRKKWL